MARPGKPNVRRARHGETVGHVTSAEYRIWQQMIARCRYPQHPRFADYGGRGITVCDRWFESLTNFIDDMGRRPSEAHSLDRIDNDLGYSPANCRWATREEQGRNRRNNIKLTVDGETAPLSVWAERTGIPYVTLRHRLVKLGWSDEETVRTPVGAAPPGRRVAGQARLQRNQAAAMLALSSAPSGHMTQAELLRLGCEPKRLRQRGYVRKVSSDRFAPLELTALGLQMLRAAQVVVTNGKVTVQ